MSSIDTNLHAKVIPGPTSTRKKLLGAPLVPAGMLAGFLRDDQKPSRLPRLVVVTGDLVKMTAMSNEALRDLEQRVEVSEKPTRKALA